MAKKIERAPAAQADVHNAKDAPEGANIEVGSKKKAKVALDPKLPKGELFVVKDTVSGHIHSDPLQKAKADVALKVITEKEAREHSNNNSVGVRINEKFAEFVLVKFGSKEKPDRK